MRPDCHKLQRAQRKPLALYSAVAVSSGLPQVTHAVSTRAQRGLAQHALLGVVVIS